MVLYWGNAAGFLGWSMMRMLVRQLELNYLDIQGHSRAGCANGL